MTERDILEMIFKRFWLRVFVLDNGRKMSVPFFINLKGTRSFIMKYM